MRTPWPKPVHLFVLTALAVGGCGNSDDEETRTTAAKPAPQAAPTKAEFVRATTRICARTDREIRAFIPLGTDPTTRRANRAGIIAVIRRQIEDMQALGYPEGAPRADLQSVYERADAVLDRAADDETIDVERSMGEALAPYQETLAEYTPNCQ